MNKKTQEIHDTLISCNLGEAFRVYVMNPKSNSEYLLCHLMLTDRFKSFEDLLTAVRNCLKEISEKSKQKKAREKRVMSHKKNSSLLC